MSKIACIIAISDTDDNFFDYEPHNGAVILTRFC